MSQKIPRDSLNLSRTHICLSLSARNLDQTERCKYSSQLPKLTHMVYREARIALQERASRSNLSVTTSSMRSGSKGDFSVFPRIDALPPILRVERQRAMSQAAQRSTSLASMASELRVYPPNSTSPFTISYHVLGSLLSRMAFCTICTDEK